SGTKLQTDMVILSIGVKPELRLAQDAGLEVNRGIKVNEYLQTTDPRIYALGDAIEVTHLITGKPAVIPLAGPANKQGRIVANNIAGRRDHYKGTQGTAVLKIFNMTVALTGANERTLKEAGLEFHSCIIHPNNHAGYYPGASPLALKLLFAPDGKILGSQIVGFSGVEKRIDVIATALRLGNSVYDLQELELAYAPPYSSAKDPVNMAGYVASNVLLGDLKIVTASDLLDSVDGNIMLLDVREPEEYTLGQIPGAVNIPLGQLRKRLGELDPEQEMIVYCAVGLRSYLASRILVHNGFNRIRNLSGGYRIFQVLQQELSNEGKATEMPSENNFRQQASNINPDETIKLDLCGLQCPGPIMQIFLKMNELSEGAVLEVCCTDPGFSSDIASWCLRTNNTLLSKGHDSRGYTAVLRKGITAAARSHTTSTIENDKTIVVFSGDLDRALAALIIANGAAAMGRKVTLFFTFWGLNILRKSEYVAVKKPFMDRMFGAMMPRGSKKLGLSRMNMLGMGPKMIRMVMKNKNVDSLELLLKQALAVGVRLVACQMSMDIMGITSEELIDGVELAGVASYLDAAESSDVNLFI
ncbi:MAG TPA: DsrE/DsrF/DrsH-like family protein, partial [Candidatus Limnocylindrales bacterium]|nr:DsrE/DsrF/DrsH-like family protein [Candidatus Limnocylindrales bacterium]